MTIKDEIKKIIALIDNIYSKFNFKYHLELSTMPKDHIGDPKDWEIATNSLMEAMQEAGFEYKINEGDGAFYGQKIDFLYQELFYLKNLFLLIFVLYIFVYLL